MTSKNLNLDQIDKDFNPDDELNQESLYDFTPSSLIENSVKMYIKSVSEIPRLSKEEELQLYSRIENGDDEARNILAEHNIRLVISIAKYYHNPGLPFEDIIQEGNFGLLTASKRFDPSKGFKFSTYATYWIRQAIGRAMATKTSIMKTSPTQKEIVKQVNKAESYLTSKLGRTPSIEEIAEYIDETPDKIQIALSSLPSISSIDTPMGDSDDGSTVADLIEDNQTLKPDDRTILLERNSHISDVLSTLSKIEEEVIRLRFGLDNEIPLTVKDIALRLNCTGTHVSNIEKKALQKLRRPERASKLKEFVDQVE